jgi:hypothetical protein
MSTPFPPASDAGATPVDATALEFDVVVYVEQMAALMALPIPAELKSGVVANFEHICAIAQPVIEFPLPETVESAVTFVP